MNLIKKFFRNRTPIASPDEPNTKALLEQLLEERIVDVEDKFRLHIFPKTLEVHDQEKIQCLSFLSEGMIKQKQQEVMVTMAVPNNAEHIGMLGLGYFLSLFKTIYYYAEQGRIVGEGEYTVFENGYLGFKGVVYAKHPRKIDPRIPDECLTITFLREREMNAVLEYGYIRILAMLGTGPMQRFPFPLWNELQRPETPLLEQMMEETILQEFGQRINFPKAQVWLKYGGKVVLSFPRNFDNVQAFAEYCQVFQPLAITCGFGPEPKPCLTWSANKEQVSIITHNDLEIEGENFALFACFLSLFPTEKKDEKIIQHIEDGFGVWMAEDTWRAFWAAFAAQEEFLLRSIPERGGDPKITGFMLTWRD